MIQAFKLSGCRCSLIGLIILGACGIPAAPGMTNSSIDAGVGYFNGGDAHTQAQPDANSNARRDSGVGPGADAGPSASPDASVLPPNPALDWRAAGDAPVQQRQANLLVANCSMNYRWFEANESAGTIVLLHGFSRRAANMFELAEHLASYGFSVLVPDLCFLGMLDTDAARSAEALMALVDAQVDGPRLYIGFSAGAMVAANCAEADPETVALFGLDPVAPRQEDQAPQGWQSDVPVGALVGDGSRCNDNNSGWPLYRAWGASGWRLRAASHCQFEGPSDAMCSMMCGGAAQDDAPTQRLNHLVTAFVQANLAQSEQAAAVWRGEGTVMNDWIAGGDLTRP